MLQEQSQISTPNQMIELLKPIWAHDLRVRQQTHVAAMQNVNAECAAKGIGASGAHIQLALKVSVDESRNRARLARNRLRKAVDQTGTRWDALQLKSMYMDIITNVNADIDRLMEEVLHVKPMPPDQFNAHMLGLAHEQVAVIEQQFAELALFAASAAPATASPGAVHVHGPVYGAVQTGSASKANVSIRIDSGSAAALRDAVHALRESLAASKPAELPPYADAMFADLETEASKPQPSSKRIVGLLTASASVIETLANAPAAWEIVKHAAAAAGIALP
jgi:hypothetical protein